MYITQGDYLKFDGLDLSIELPDDDNPLGKVERFIEEVETWTMRKIRKFGFSENKVNESNIQDFKYGLMYQMRHFLRYGRDGMLDNDAFDCFQSAGLVSVVLF